MNVTRRTFFGTTAAGIAAATVTKCSAQSVSETIRLGVMGTNGRGSALARGFAARKDAEVTYVCDVDTRAQAKAVEAVSQLQKTPPRAVGDFRQILDDKGVDALVVATPNHWHAIAAILACKAGKHVYVEKPCSHTPLEGELAVQAARKYDRVVNMGTQRRTWPAIREGIQRIHNGDIGEVRYARSWYNNRRGSIGKGKLTAVPSWLDYELWQGPCTDKPFKDNLIHYNWHWHWHWGNGELGNNGVHALDVARWGMNVDYPTRVVSAGGRYRYDDDQETPDTHNVAFEFEGRSISWEGLSCSPLGFEGSMFGVSFHGDKGSLVIDGAGYKIYDMHNKQVESQSGAGGDSDHLANFLDCVRSGQRPNADIEEAHRSTLLCHLGNISQRTGRALRTNGANGHIEEDAEAASLWSKKYRTGWEPTV